MVITALTRNQVYRQRYRGFESHPLRQILVESAQSEAFWLNTFTIFHDFFWSFLVAACAPNSYLLQISVQETPCATRLSGFLERKQERKTTPFPPGIQALKAWRLPRTALCCSPDGHRCLPSWRSRCVQAIPGSVSSGRHLPA